MKKIVSLLFIVTLLLPLVACGNQTEEIVIPSSFFSEEEVEQIIEEVDGDDDAEVTINDDGDFVYQMPKAEYDEMMTELADDIDEMIEGIDSDESISSVTSIEANGDYSVFTITVDRAAFEEGFEGMFVMGLGISGVFYQIFDTSSDQESVTIEYVDAETNEVYDSIVYPDALEE